MASLLLPEAPDLTAKRLAWRKQHTALGAPLYRITLTPRRDHLEARNFRNEGHKRRCVPERFWSAEQVNGFIPELRKHNWDGYDIYVTPIDPQHHYLVIDDVHPTSLQAIHADGLTPCLVQRSSDLNYQVVLRTLKAEDSKREQSAANAVVVSLNQRFGDEKFSGAIHPFRMAGFSNKKPGRADAFTEVTYRSPLLRCGRTALLLGDERVRRQAHEQRRLEAEVHIEEWPSPNQPAGAVDGNLERAKKDFELERARVLNWVKRSKFLLDESKVDFRAAKALLERGAPEAVVLSVLTSHVRVVGKHQNPSDYARRTVSAAQLAMRRKKW